MDTGIYGKALLIREVERKLLELFEQGRLSGTVHTCIGQEFSGIAVASALREGDLIFSNHRCHGHFLARTDDVEGLIAEIMGKRSGVCGGRGGSQHLCSRGFFSNGVQGGIVPVAAGLAFALKLRKTSDIAVVFIGDGTLGEGVLYETLNIASQWELPLLLVLENNLYSQSTPQRQTLAGDILARAAAFAVATGQGNTWEPSALLAAAAAAVQRVRTSSRPLLLKIDTYRLMAHSKGDDDRAPEEVKKHWQRDPLSRFVLEHAQAAAGLQAAATRRVTAAVAQAESAGDSVGKQGDADAAGPRRCVWAASGDRAEGRIAELLHSSFQRNMRRDERIILIGEDIEAPYGGAFKVTKDLSLEFPGRVRNAPLSEAALVGLGTGLAMQGFFPVVEIMFGDFLALAADQLINHAVKFHYMYNGQVRVPLIVRTPMGGRRGYGPTHSQSLEKHFLGLPGSRVLALHRRQDPGAVYDALFKGIDRPTLVIENKLLYGARLTKEVPKGFLLEHSDDPFPTARLRPQGRAELTLLCYGGMLPEAEAAAERLFEEHDVLCEILCPLQLYPFNIGPVLESVRRTGRLLVVEEGLGFAAFGAEVIAQVAACEPQSLKAVARLAAAAHPIPACAALEKTVLPGSAHIVEKARSMLHES